MNGELKVIDAEYFLSGDSPEPLFPEVAIVGRSNAGKSSLINALCERRKLVRTGRTPGQTRKPNFFRVRVKRPEEVRSDFYLIDFPGYGYASRSMEEREEWADELLGFLDDALRIQRLLLVMDVRRQVEDAEEEIVRSSHQREVIVALSKCDKIKRSEFISRRLLIAQALSLNVADVIPVSSQSGEGITELRERIFAKIDRALI